MRIWLGANKLDGATALHSISVRGMDAVQVSRFVNRSSVSTSGAFRGSQKLNLAQPPECCSCNAVIVSTSPASVDTAVKEFFNRTSSSFRLAAGSSLPARLPESYLRSISFSRCSTSFRRNDHDRRSALRSHRKSLCGYLVEDTLQCPINNFKDGCTFLRFPCATCSAATWRVSAARRASESVFAPTHFSGRSPLQDKEDALSENFPDDGLWETSPFLHHIRMQKNKLLGPAIFNASKLRVLLPGRQNYEGPWQHPRVYTLTHCDLTAEITLTISHEINKTQVNGWYSKLQRDEVLAEWRRHQGEMSLHVHCHISGSNLLHRLVANLRFYMFQKELPLVIEAFLHGDRTLFRDHPELQVAQVWVYFHSNVERFNRVECWGPVLDAAKRQMPGKIFLDLEEPPGDANWKSRHQFPETDMCLKSCECCSRHAAVIPLPESLKLYSQRTKSHDISTLKAL